MTRDEAREFFSDSDFSVTESDIFLLISIMSRVFLKNGLLSIDIKNASINCWNDGVIKNAYIPVKSSYFDNREGITFNSDGWIGIAGWADSKNVRPIILAFVLWVRKMRRKVNYE